MNFSNYNFEGDFSSGNAQGKQGLETPSVGWNLNAGFICWAMTRNRAL